MIQFQVPTNLNGAELRQELNAGGVFISNDTFAIILDDEKNLCLDIAEVDKDKAAVIVAAHNGTTVAPEPTVAQKLTLVGLSLEELRTALGSN
jgi:hypothetical protein